MMEDPPLVTILLLGDPECGKSTFLASLSSKGIGSNSSSTAKVPILRDLDQPFVYDVRMYNRFYRFEFYDTASPENYTLLHPDFVILCYSISNRRSLINTRDLWRKDIVRHYAKDRENIPVMLLGLKRDLRVEDEGTIYPQEAYAMAQEMRCDRYAECSALTGELMSEVFEDVARTAAKTTTEAGGQTSGACKIM